MPLPLPPPMPAHVVVQAAELDATRRQVRETLARLRRERRTTKQGDSTLIKLRDSLRASNLVEPGRPAPATPRG